jgi:dTDP-4-dehydrorhamnose reductase
MSETVLITGANGLLGQNLTNAFSGASRVVLADLHPKSVLVLPKNTKYQSTNLTDFQAVKSLVKSSSPSVIIHAAAMTDVDGCEECPQLAREVNVGATGHLLKILSPSCVFVYLSTDYVFDGNSGPYSETDAPNPLGVYGQTKYEAEKLVQSMAANYLIIRTMVLYGTGKNLRSQFPDWVLGMLEKKAPFPVVSDQMGNPTLASHLAFTMRLLLNQNCRGIYHVCGNEILSRHQFACAIADAFGCNKELILPCKTEEIHQKAKRPLNSGFILSKARGVPGMVLPSIGEQLEQYKREKQHG